MRSYRYDFMFPSSLETKTTDEYRHLVHVASILLAAERSIRTYRVNVAVAHAAEQDLYANVMRSRIRTADFGGFQRSTIFQYRQSFHSFSILNGCHDVGFIVGGACFLDVCGVRSSC